MSESPTPIVIFLYNRLFDPLIQGNFWLYIKDYLSNPHSQVRFHLVTFEDPIYPLTEAQKAQSVQWREQGLEWTALRWHRGIGLKQKLFDFISGFRTVCYLRAKGYRHVVTLGSIAGTFAYTYSVLLRMRLFLYQYEPHSEYAVDNGMWAIDSIQTKMSRFLERRAAMFASVIASGTRAMRVRVLEEWGSGAEFIQIPTVVNDRKFLFDGSIRQAVRNDLGLTEDVKVIFYPGKFGDLYYGDEVAWMFSWLLRFEPQLFFLIVTPHDDDEVHARFARAGVSRDCYSVRHSDYVDIHQYFFAADFAVIAVPPGPSKKFISNIKVGEYLCSGLPYLITHGVSEDYLFALENNVGVVVNDFKEEPISQAWPRIQNYLQQDQEFLRAHCRQKGLEYRGFDTLNPKFKQAIATLIGTK